MSKEYFTIKEDKGKVWIVNNTASHIDGKPFKYRQVDKCRAEILCEMLNHMKQESFNLQEIMTIIHNIKYGNWKLEDLMKYIYEGIDIKEIYKEKEYIYEVMYCRYGELDENRRIAVYLDEKKALEKANTLNREYWNRRNPYYVNKEEINEE